MTVEQITQPMLKQFRVKFNDAVKDLAEEFGLDIKLTSISYDATEFTGKIQCRLSSVSPYQKFEDTFNQCYKFYDLNEDMLGKTFKTQGKEFTFVGLDTKKRNYPCICTCNDGKQYKFTTQQIQLLLK